MLKGEFSIKIFKYIENSDNNVDKRKFAFILGFKFKVFNFRNGNEKEGINCKLGKVGYRVFASV